MTIPTEPPREKRNSVIVRALITPPGGASSERRVRNLSRSGACIDHDGELAAGMRIGIVMGRITDLVGEVVWAKERLAGIRFAEPVDLDEARQPRGTTASAKAGWIASINDAYRR